MATLLRFLQRGRLGLNQLKQIHSLMIINGLNIPQAMGKLIECYCAASASDYAHIIYNSINEPSVFIHNVMIRCFAPSEGFRHFADGVLQGELVLDKHSYIFALGACARMSSPKALWEGRQIHSRLFKMGYVLNVVLQTTAIHFYASCHDCRSARQVFDEMSVRNIATWNAMISGYCSQGKRGNDNAHKAALTLFHEMQVETVEPTDTTLVCVLSACANLGDLVMGSCVHARIEKLVYIHEDVFLGTGLVDMYSKCGCLSSARSVFDRMGVKNVLTWTAMMAGLALHGEGKMALEMFKAMERTKIRPNTVTFTSLLFACCHAGLIDEGVLLFKKMTSEFNLTPCTQHYGCMVDLLGRAGRLQEAYEFIVEMPVKPDAILWRSLLAACRIHGDVEMGKKMGKLLLELQEPGEQRCEDFVALSNVYALGGSWNNVEEVRNMMRGKKIEIKSGRSIVQSV